MYRAMIADDEPWSVYRIQNLIDWKSIDFEIVGTATDGLSALALAKEKQPDLLFSDIRMPGLNGLELVREIKSVSPGTISILITGFSDFSYAQEAIRQGVFDFLVKPVKKEDLSHVLDRVIQRLQENNSPTEHELFFSVLAGEQPHSISELFTALGSEVSCSHCCIMTSAFSEKLDGSLIQKETENLPSLCFRTGTKELSTLLQLEPLSPADTLLVEKAKKIPALYTGFSDILPIDTVFSVLFLQSKTAMLTAAMRKSPDPVFYSSKPSKLVQQILTQFSTALRSKDQATLIMLLDKLSSSTGNFQIDTLLGAVNQMTALLYEYRYGDYEALEMHHLQQLDFDNPLEMLIASLRYAVGQYNTENTIPPTQFREIMNVIEENYMNDIRLTDLADHFYLSANYLSILIKRETGLTFSNLLIQKRIGLAKKMLVETNLPIQDIMSQVGYKDYSYFVKLFKKQVNCTPYAYRKKAIQNEYFDKKL